MRKKVLSIMMSSLCASFLLSTQAQAEAYGDDQCCEVPNYCYPCDSCECPNRFWADAEYLFWKIQDSPRTPPLVTEGPTAASTVLGATGGDVILGRKRINNRWRSGGRFALGYWFDEDCSLGAEANYFFLGRESRKHTVASTGGLGSLFLGVPFFDVTTGLESSTLIAFPGLFSGHATLKVANRMQGAELNGLYRIPWNCDMNVSLLAGFRWWNFDEHLKFDTSSPFINIPTNIFITRDKFHSENNFYGGQLGLCVDYSYCQFFLNLKGKVALGAMCERANIHGALITNDFTDFNSVEVFEGGIFTNPGNIGHHTRTKFAVLPEVDVNVGYQVMDNLRFQVGYTFLYVSELLWATKQIDRNINPDEVVGLGGVPGPDGFFSGSGRGSRHRTDSLWVQGLNVGFEFRF